MLKDINPQFTYYIMLFLLTLILRSIRAYNGRPTDSSSKAAKAYWVNYLYCGFEMVNVSAGVFILITQSATNYVGTIMMLYVILVVVSFFLEGNNIGRSIKALGHSAVSIVIFGVTIYAFLIYDGLKPTAAQPCDALENRERTWKVALPYLDTSLNRYHGAKHDVILSFWSDEVNATSKADAIIAAKKRFQASDGPTPFQVKQEKTLVSMVVIDEKVVAEPLPLPKTAKP